MNIAELFVKLGITGADKTKNEVAGVGESLKQVGGIALETKVAIAAMVYGLYKFTSEGSKMGTSLQQFATLTGMNIEQLQKYEYAMIQSGGTTDDFRQSISSLQDTMTRMRLGKGVPDGLSFIDQVVKFDKTKMTDMFYVIQKLQEFATNKNLDASIRKEKLKSFIGNDAVISSLMQDVYNKKNFDAAPIITEKNTKALKNIDRGWENLFHKLKIGMANLNIHFSPKILDELNKAVPVFFKLAEAFAKLMESSKALELLSASMEKMAIAADTITTSIQLVNGLLGDKSSESALKKRLEADYKKDHGGVSADFNMKKYNEDAVKAYKERHGIVDRVVPNSPALKAFVGPPAPADVQLNQVLNFNHPGTNAIETGKSVKKAAAGVMGKMKTKKQVN